MSKHPAWKATRYAAHTAEKAITGLGRWAVTDHTGTAKLLGAVFSALLVYLLVARGIPWLL